MKPKVDLGKYNSGILLINQNKKICIVLNRKTGLYCI